ncbi:MAG: ParM/StbA family protein [Peptococcaceae bacterium]|nr:ParM/StbA family protein [Peptococcaceae bacterium]MDH7523843.1 ParM/StbA family protein [Peptococcaceae bacterium]
MFYKQIGVDLGYGYVKVTDGTKEHIFPSTVGLGTDLKFNSLLLNPKNITDNLVVTVDNKKFFVGDLAIRQSPIVSRSLGRNRLEDINAKVLLLTSLALFMDKGEQKFNVVAGLPVDYYQLYKDDWSRLMQGNHAVRFGGFNEDVPLNITIEKIQLIPQPFGTLYDRRLDQDGTILENDLSHLKIGIVDVGYKTTDLAFADDLEFVGKQSISCEIAMSTAYGMIADKIKEKFKVERAMYELKILETDTLRIEGVPKDISDINKEAFRQLAEKIATEVNSIWDKRQLDIILLTGGGGKAISEYFLPKFPQATLAKNPQFANVHGYLKLANNLFKKKAFSTPGTVNDSAKAASAEK